MDISAGCGVETIYLVTLLIALGMLALLISMVADVGMPGLQQRVFIFLFFLWLSIVVHKAVRVTATNSFSEPIAHTDQ